MESGEEREKVPAELLDQSFVRSESSDRTDCGFRVIHVPEDDSHTHHRADLMQSGLFVSFHISLVWFRNTFSWYR